MDGYGLRQYCTFFLSHKNFKVFGDADANKIVNGLAIHWYDDDNEWNNNPMPASVLTQVHQRFPEKWILYTEACNTGPKLGSWSQGDRYAHSIIEVRVGSYNRRFLIIFNDLSK